MSPQPRSRPTERLRALLVPLGLTLALVACEDEPSAPGDAGVPSDATMVTGAPPGDASMEAGTSDAASPVDGSPNDAQSPDASDASHDFGIDDRRASPEWHSYGHDLFNHRANLKETTIGVANVGRLERKWNWASDTQAVTSTPAYHDGTLYFGNYLGEAVALEAETGEMRWLVEPTFQLMPMITSSPVVSGDTVYFTADSARVFALDRNDGSVRWNVAADNYWYSRIWSSPLLVDDIVLVGTGSQQVFVPPPPLNPVDFIGAIMGLDASDGSVRWRFELTTGTGVTVTSSPAVDPGRGLLYIGTGQQYAGDTPYSDALVALHYETGAYAWHFQFTAGDNYWWGDTEGGPDFDVLSTPVLYTAKGVDGVVVGDKGGRVVALERESGEALWQRQLTVGGRHGGVMSSPAYHDGLLFLCAGQGETLDPNDEGQGSGAPQKSVLFALDLADDGSSRWSTAIDSGCFGGVSYANGVVYLPTTDGHARAFDAGDGRALWDEDMGNPLAGGITVVDGHLYIAHGWDWTSPWAPGGVAAYGLPD